MRLATPSISLLLFFTTIASASGCSAVQPSGTPRGVLTSSSQDDAALPPSPTEPGAASTGAKTAPPRIEIEPITVNSDCNYADLVNKTSQLSTYARLAKSVGWLAKHRDDTGVTFLVPVNEAFEALDNQDQARLDKDRKWLYNVLANHTLMGTLRDNYFAKRNGTQVKTMSQASDTYDVTAGDSNGTRLGSAELRQQIECGGVVLHVVDAVLVPNNFDPTRPKNPMRASIWFLEE